jgi:hypothetical protein
MASSTSDKATLLQGSVNHAVARTCNSKRRWCKEQVDITLGLYGDKMLKYKIKYGFSSP